MSIKGSKSSLMEYFKSRNQESAINKMSKHMAKVVECVVELEKALNFLFEEKNYDLALKVFIRVNDLEHQADIIRRDILNMLSEAELKTSVRENLSRLTKRIDDIANAASAFSRIIIYLNYEDLRKIDAEVQKKIVDMGAITVECVKKLFNMLKKMIKEEIFNVQESANEINLLEHKCDEMHFAMNRILVASGNSCNINPFSAYEIMKMLTKLENVSDAAEAVADYLVILDIMTKK
ncbi:MAG: DUF47 domain-containing protein [Promethearchaeota archaeon]